MGQDKARLMFGDVSFAQHAVQGLQQFCAAVSIAGNRPDLAGWVPVVPETRCGFGPVAGIEAGLQAASQPWALFVPVDVPLAPGTLLRAWAVCVLERARDGVRVSYLRVAGDRQPSFCLIHRSALAGVAAAADAGQGRIAAVLEQAAGALGPAALWVPDAEAIAADSGLETINLAAAFRNINTPADLAWLEGHSQSPVEPLATGRGVRYG